jgi:hypothetical protein
MFLLAQRFERLGWRFLGALPSRAAVRRFFRSPELRALNLPPNLHRHRKHYIPPVAPDEVEALRGAVRHWIARGAE